MKMRTGMKRKTNHFPLQVTWKIRRPKRKQKGQESRDADNTVPGPHGRGAKKPSPLLNGPPPPARPDSASSRNTRTTALTLTTLAYAGARNFQSGR
jgi:hypothetical protein